MKRPLPLWLAVVVPATIAGHGLAYALTKQSAADSHHAWIVPALECSLALLVAAVLVRAGDSLLRAHVFVHTAVERSCLALWTRLALAQTLLFYAIEHAEGREVSFASAIVQIAVALLAAFIVSLFARVLGACTRCAQRAIQYLVRLFQPVTSFVSRQPAPVAYALAVHAGTARFQRPPPQT